jgi:hypothetical protein
LFEKKSQVLRTLEERRPQYKALLKELEGCAEMVIRALIQDCGTAAGIDGLSNYQSSTLARDTSGPGREYLNARMAHYAVEDRLAGENGLLLERCREVFDGLFVKCKSEYP